MIRTVLFDLDDTLYDEVDYCKSGFAAVSEFVAKRPRMPAAQRIYEALWREFELGNRTRTFNAALEQLHIACDDESVRQLVEVYRNHVPEIELPTDSREVLEQLRQKYTLGLLTDGFLPAQQIKVRALGIEHYFQCIIYTEQLGREFWKPSPVGFEKLLEALSTTAAGSVYVGDNPAKDFIAPNQMGFVTIEIARPGRLHRQGSDAAFAAAKHKIDTIGRLPALLAGL